MLKRIINVGVKSNHGFRERRAIQVSNVISITAGLLLIPMSIINIRIEEELNALILFVFGLTFLLNLYWNKIGAYGIPKFVLAFLISINPFIHLLLTGHTPEGQYLSYLVIPIILASISGILYGGKKDRVMFFTSLLYWIIWMLFIDIIIYNMSNPKPDIQFIFDNYYFYKAPPLAAILIMVSVIAVFNNIINKYEEENELAKKLLSDQNVKLESMNAELEQRVQERTSKLAEMYKKIVKLAFITSHELRGPLASILGFTQLFNNQESSTELIDHLPKLHDKAEEMDKVISKMNSELENMPDAKDLN